MGVTELMHTQQSYPHVVSVSTMSDKKRLLTVSARGCHKLTTFLKRYFHTTLLIVKSGQANYCSY